MRPCWGTFADYLQEDIDGIFRVKSLAMSKDAFSNHMGACFGGRVRLGSVAPRVLMWGRDVHGIRFTGGSVMDR